jgi:hypothetical protein
LLCNPLASIRVLLVLLSEWAKGPIAHRRIRIVKYQAEKMNFYSRRVLQSIVPPAGTGKKEFVKMSRPRISLVLALTLAAVALTAPRSFGASAQPLNCTWDADYFGIGIPGVYGDNPNTTNGDANYNHSSARNGVKCYLGVNGKDFDLVTYNTGRTLHFVFPAGSGIPTTSGTADNFFAEVDLFGINYFGPFRTMGIGTTALLQVDLEFHYPTGPNPLSYELEYRALAVMRTAADQWLITSNPIEICGSSTCSGLGFTPSSAAKLNVIRRKSVETIRQEVLMPIRFRAKYQP